MGNFYVDDSVHDNAGFIVCACVYAPPEIEQAIVDLMIVSKIDPNTFEYKSSANYSKFPDYAEFRSELKGLVQEHCRYGIVILPRDKREIAGKVCLFAIEQFINANTIVTPPISIFMDKGLFHSEKVSNDVFNELKIADAKCYAEQDSKLVRGIQLADLVAHMVSIQLKSAMGLVTKKVRAGENSGYEPDTEMELSFEMYTTLRYSIFNEGNNKPQTGDQFMDAVMVVGKAGLFISEDCPPNLRDLAEHTFGTVYLGCVH